MELANIYNYQELHLEPEYPITGLSYKGWQLVSFKQPSKKERYEYTITLSYKPSFRQRIQEIIEPRGRIQKKNLLSFEVFIPDDYLENRNIWFKLCWQAAKAFIDSDKNDFQANSIWIRALENLERSLIIRYKLQDKIFEIHINDISWVNTYYTRENPFTWQPHYKIELKSGEIIKLEFEQIAEAYSLDFSRVYRYNRVLDVMSELANMCLDKLQSNNSHTNADIFLFDSSQAAQEVAYSLRVDSDGCNSLKLNNQNYQDLKSAAIIFNTEYCQVGKVCKIPDKRDERHLMYIDRFSFLPEPKAFAASNSHYDF